MDSEENKEELGYTEKVKCVVENEIEQLINNGLNEGNLDILFKLVDIDKDIENINYWNVKKEVMKMRYNNYSRYSEGRYGRRDMQDMERGRYRENYSEGHEMLDDMRDSYSAYSESRNAYGRGNYNAGQDSMKALEDTMEIFTEFAQKMIDEVDGPEAKQIVKKHLRKISQMG